MDTQGSASDHKRDFLTFILTATILAMSTYRCNDAYAASAAIPATVTPTDLVTEPSVNLGFTSFYDGFGPIQQGFTFIDYGRWQHLTSISDSKGNSIAAFHRPDIEALSNLFEPAYTLPTPKLGGAIDVLLVLPVVDLSSSFTQPGANLRANGFNIGDLTLGVAFQKKPVTLFGKPFSYRAEFDVFAPIGGFDKTKDINQSSGFWSLAPYLSMTWLPAAGLEFSTRLHYLYNFKTTNIPDRPIDEASVSTGQAGQAFFMNFDGSQRVTHNFSIGVNGYYFQQLSNDKVDGIGLAHTIKNQLYLGPGISWQIKPTELLNVNLYVPVTTHGVATGPQLNFEFINPF